MELKNAKGKSIVSYNVENFFDTVNDPMINDSGFTPLSPRQWNQKKYKQKIHNISKVIFRVNNDFPAIIGLVEIETRAVLTDLITSKHLLGGNYGIVHVDSPDERGMDVAFLYQKDYFHVLEFENMEVTFDDDLEDTTRDILYIKGEFANNDTFHFFVNHWPSRREGEFQSKSKRVKAAKILKAKTDDILSKNKNAKIFIMGDFNDYPNSHSVEITLNASNDIHFKENDFFNLAYRDFSNKKGTAKYRGKWNLLDQMMISEKLITDREKLRIKPDSFYIFWKKWILFKHPRYKDYTPKRTYGRYKYYGGYSDHLPISVKLS